jgi:DNA end-binding protein Ku
MTPRTNWKGYLKLSLVSCAVALYPALALSERVSFHMLNRSTGNRVKRQFVDAETGHPVEPEDQVKGYEIGKGQHILVEDYELDAVALESTHTIEIDRFVPRAEVDERFIDSPYYLAHADRVAQEAFAIIREAMRRKGVVGIARVVLQRRERVLMLQPFGKGLLAITLRYAHQVRTEGAAFEDIADVELQEEMLDLATRIIETKTGKFDVSRYEDRYENALLDLVKAKESGRAVEPPRVPPPGPIIDLMEALRRSIASEKAAAEQSRSSEEARNSRPNDTSPPPRVPRESAQVASLQVDQ